MGNPKSVSISEFAEAVGVSRDTIRRRISDGTISAFRVGTKAIRIPLTELDKLMDAAIPSAKG